MWFNLDLDLESYCFHLKFPKLILNMVDNWNVFYLNSIWSGRILLVPTQNSIIEGTRLNRSS